MVHNVVVPSQDVLVIGGGIGGLAAALALTTSGQTVRVIEQAPAFGEIGAGLQLGPNATRILESWGLLDAVIDAGVLPRNLVLRDAINGAEIARVPLLGDFLARYGAPYVVIHRTDLHQILLEACVAAGVELTTDTRISSVSQDDSGTTARCEGGRTFRASAVIGADGLHSALREEIVGDGVVPSGYVAYRGTVQLDEVLDDPDLDDVVCWVAPDAHVVQYRLRAGSVLNLVATFRSPGFEEGALDYGTPAELEAVFADCHPRVLEAVARVSRQRRWPLFDREPAEHWGSGRVLLTGDAAHPMLQFLAQGCCQALEDAQTLGLLVGQSDGPTDWPQVVQAFSTARIPRTAEVQRRARVFGEICHADGTARLLRNVLLERTGADLTAFTDWLYAGSTSDRLAPARPFSLA